MVDITVRNVNRAPVAHAGTAQTVDERTQVTLDGRGSSDPDGDSLTYWWAQIAGPLATLTNTTSAQLVFTAPDVPTDEVLTFQPWQRWERGLLGGDGGRHGARREPLAHGQRGP